MKEGLRIYGLSKVLITAMLCMIGTSNRMNSCVSFLSGVLVLGRSARMATHEVSPYILPTV